jgi:hypothetical protein
MLFPRFLLRASAAAALLVSLGASSAVLAAPEAATKIPAPSSVLWGAYVPGAPWDASLLDTFESRSGKKMSIVHWGQPWLIKGSYQKFQKAQVQAVTNRGSIPLIDWGSWELSKGQNQSAFTLAKISNGNFDAYIKEWAQAARAWGQPFFLRFDWEMNGWWQFPWAEQLNGNKPGDYVKAWRHVHDIFTQQGATNVTWVWCPNISSTGTTALSSLYPGDDYVDWTCMDGYNRGTDKGNRWQSFKEVFAGGRVNSHNTYQELVNLAPSKPIMIGETASSENGGSKASWISDMFFELPRSFPQIKALVWFNWNSGDTSISWPLQSSESAYSAFAVGLAGGDYAGDVRSISFGTQPVVVPEPGPPPVQDVVVEPPVDPGMLLPEDLPMDPQLDQPDMVGPLEVIGPPEGDPELAVDPSQDDGDLVATDPG